MSFLESLFSLQGRLALITGGTRGIGQTMALALAKAGADLVLVQRDPSNQDTADQARELGRRVTVIECDLADKESVSTIVHRVTASEEDGGLGLTIDILVNCGGIQRRAPAETFTDENWNEVTFERVQNVLVHIQKVLQVNLNAVFTLSRDVGAHMLKTRGVGSQTHRGKIINIASLLSHQGGLTVPAYAAAKHGVFGLIKALSNEWSPKGVNVNGISPGYIATEVCSLLWFGEGIDLATWKMNTALIADPVRSRQILERIPAQRWGSPADFEGAIVFLASRASDYVCGESLVVDGGWMGR
ncbi:ATP-binding cassette transporter [Mycena indigotica]|uniref:ATP-binding cassette transporter n=1 Tax=Mycena indigotica TaxID=2126181 RepID=A0A8H6TFF8_9AGAR|nr:ATP-binding cassette transporter [Mycena indigotica]KAF7315772.1 ATP-binding cassette transporter [Mycena indigotica]